jgi:hypothetical protein
LYLNRVKKTKMKLFIPPIVTVVLAIVMDKLIDLMLGLGPYNESGTPGLVYAIEAVLIVVLIFIGILIHGLIILRTVKKHGKEGFKRIIKWGLLVISIISGFYIFVITEELEYSFALKIQNGLIFFFMLIFILLINLLTLRIINKTLANNNW